MITNFVDFYANDQKLKTHYFSSLGEGPFELKAKYQEIVSNAVSVEVQAGNTRGKKVLIEEFTGEWCGFCPTAAYNLSLLASRSDVVIMTAIFSAQRPGDKYEYKHVDALERELGINGAPHGLADRREVEGRIQAASINHAEFKPVLDQIEEIFETPAQLGIAIETELSGSTVTIKPSIKFYEEITSGIYYTIYINENKLDGTGQANYYSGSPGYQESKFYTQPDILTDYEHNHVLRKNVTDAFGKLIPASSVVLNGVYEPSPVDVDLSEYVVENCEIVVFVHQSLRGSGGKSVFNTQMVAPGESVDYLGTLSK
ncbi:MAG: Omp28-related outer membrane protein [Ekhidna sp.]|nr:Omp28-related outer membrane protein [Ekhidna sp.]